MSRVEIVNKPERDRMIFAVARRDETADGYSATRVQHVQGDGFS